MRLLLVAATELEVAPLAGPVLLSTDAYTYWAYGRIGAVHGENPYDVPPSAFPDDPAYAVMGEDWRNTTSVYGPGFTLVSEGHAAVVGDSPDAAAWRPSSAQTTSRRSARDSPRAGHSP